MRAVGIGIGLALLLSMPAWGEQATQMRVFKVLDGDRVLARTRYHSHNLQLNGIDAPELDQPGGQFSKTVLSKMIAGQQVVIEAQGEAVDGETLVQMRLRDYDINLEMVRAGAAWAGPDAGATLRDAEAEARAARKGIWGMPGEPVAPWVWRTDREARHR